MFIRGGANNRVFVRKVPIVWPGGCNGWDVGLATQLESQV